MEKEKKEKYRKAKVPSADLDEYETLFFNDEQN